MKNESESVKTAIQAVVSNPVYSAVDDVVYGDVHSAVYAVDWNVYRDVSAAVGDAVNGAIDRMFARLRTEK